LSRDSSTLEQISPSKRSSDFKLFAFLTFVLDISLRQGNRKVVLGFTPHTD
jgi:hypothetical protein